MQDITIRKLRQKRNARRVVLAASVLLLCIPLAIDLLPVPSGAKDWIAISLVLVVLTGWLWGGYQFFHAPCPRCQHGFAKIGFFGLMAWPELIFRTECRKGDAPLLAAHSRR
jgi:hypothetical protein